MAFCKYCGRRIDNGDFCIKCKNDPKALFAAAKHFHSREIYELAVKVEQKNNAIQNAEQNQEINSWEKLTATKQTQLLNSLTSLLDNENFSVEEPFVSQFKIGYKNEQNKNYENACEWYKEAVEHGNISSLKRLIFLSKNGILAAQKILSDFYLTGNVISKTIIKALKLNKNTENQENKNLKKNEIQQNKVQSPLQLYEIAKDSFEKSFYEEAVEEYKKAIEAAKLKNDNEILEKANIGMLSAEREKNKAVANKKLFEAKILLKEDKITEALALYEEANKAADLSEDSDFIDKVTDIVAKVQIFADNLQDNTDSYIDSFNLKKFFYYSFGKAVEVEKWKPICNSKNIELKYLKDLNFCQYEAATADMHKHICVTAGAGSGKTKTLVSRIAYLLNNDVLSERILVLTFSKKAADELKERLQRISENADVSAKTFHSWCMAVLHKYSAKFDFKNYYKLLADGDSEKLFSIVISEVVHKEKKWIFEDDTDENNENFYTNENAKRRLLLTTDVFFCYSYIKEAGVTLQVCLQRYYPKILNFDDETKNFIISCLEKLFEKYEQKKHELGRYDFIDLLCIVKDKICEDKNICKMIGSKYDYILIDEMQDTSFVQWKIVSQLAKYSKLFCVGDIAQAVYSFRGGDFRFMQDFELKNSIKLKLEENYRSTQELLDLSNWLLKKSPSVNYEKNLHSVRGSGKIPALHTFENENAESLWIVRDILKRTFINRAKTRDFCIIVRSAMSIRPY